MGGDALCFRRGQAGRENQRRRSHRLVPGESRELQVPAAHRVHGTAEDLDGQDPEIQAARNGEGAMIAKLKYPLPHKARGSRPIVRHRCALLALCWVVSICMFSLSAPARSEGPEQSTV